MSPDPAAAPTVAVIVVGGLLAALALAAWLRRRPPLLAFAAPPLPVPASDAALLVCAMIVGGYFLRGFWPTGIGLAGIVGLLLLHRVPVGRHFGPGTLSVPGALLGGLWVAAATTPFLLLGAGATEAVLRWLGHPPDVEPAVALFRDAHGWRQLLPLFLAATVLAPIAEEALFRGFLQPIFKRHAGGLRAWIAVALLFAGCHATLSVFPPLLLFGLVLGLAYERTGGSLLLCISAHFWFNLLNATLLTLGLDPSP